MKLHILQKLRMSDQERVYKNIFFEAKISPNGGGEWPPPRPQKKIFLNLNRKKIKYN